MSGFRDSARRARRVACPDVNAKGEAAAMKSVLVLYMSRGGHTARIARRICEGIAEAGGRGEMMDINEAVHEGVDWGRYDVVAFGAPVLYGTYHKSVFEFIARHRA
jgi:menaquinone-dependent protoporphyrinogen oxidase